MNTESQNIEHFHASVSAAAVMDVCGSISVGIYFLYSQNSFWKM